MAMFSKRPPSLAHLSDEAAARALSRHFGDFVKAARDLNVKRTDLRKLTWSNPSILTAAHERMDLFVSVMWSEAVRGLDSKVWGVRARSADRLLAHPYAVKDPFASGLALLAPARRPRAASDGEKVFDCEVVVELEREAAIERDGDRRLEQAADRQRELEREREVAGEQVAVVNLRKTLPDRKALPVRNARPVQAGSLWPAGIRRPSRGRGWR